MATHAYNVVAVAEDFQPTPPWQYLQYTSINLDLGELLGTSDDSSNNLKPKDPFEHEKEVELKSPSILQKIQQDSVNYQRLSTTECISAYSTSFLSTRRNLVLVTNSPSSANGSLLAFGSYLGYPREDSFRWMCNSIYTYDSSDPNMMCRGARAEILAKADDWQPFKVIAGNLTPRVQFCLSEIVPEACSLQFSFVIILIVIICNIGKTLIMTFATFKMTWQPLITVGDGIGSFLVEPDKTTKNACLLTANKAEDLGPFSWFKFMWTSKKIRWFQSSSLRRWLVCNTL